MNQELLHIATEIQLFSTVEEKATFLFVIGALMTRIISLAKAAEIMGIDREKLGDMLELMGIEYSYLTVADIAREKGE